MYGNIHNTITYEGLQNIVVGENSANLVGKNLKFIPESTDNQLDIELNNNGEDLELKIIAKDKFITDATLSDYVKSETISTPAVGKLSINGTIYDIVNLDNYLSKDDLKGSIDDEYLEISNGANAYKLVNYDKLKTIIDSYTYNYRTRGSDVQSTGQLQAIITNIIDRLAVLEKE